MSVADVTSRISADPGPAGAAALRPGTAPARPGAAFSARSTTPRRRPARRPPAAGSTPGRGRRRRGQEVPRRALRLGRHRPDEGAGLLGPGPAVYYELGYDLPRVSYQQAEAGAPVDGLAKAQPGDILAFGSPGHHIAHLHRRQPDDRGAAPGQGRQDRARSTRPRPRSAGCCRTPAGGAVGTRRRDRTGRVAAGTPYASLFSGAAAKYGVSADLLSAVAKQESGYNPSAASPAGAQGLMQLMPATARGLGVTNPFDPAQAVDGAARLLSSLLDRFGSTELALAAYNAGPGAVLRYDGIPPYAETRTTSAPSCRRWRPPHEPHDPPRRARRRDHGRPRRPAARAAPAGTPSSGAATVPGAGRRASSQAARQGTAAGRPCRLRPSRPTSRGGAAGASRAAGLAVVGHPNRAGDARGGRPRRRRARCRPADPSPRCQVALGDARRSSPQAAASSRRTAGLDARRRPSPSADAAPAAPTARSPPAGRPARQAPTPPVRRPRPEPRPRRRARPLPTPDPATSRGHGRPRTEARADAVAGSGRPVNRRPGAATVRRPRQRPPRRPRRRRPPGHGPGLPRGAPRVGHATTAPAG